MPSTRRLVPAVAGAAGLACALAGLAPLPALAAPPAAPYLSEIHYDDDGTDAGEFVEVHLPPGTSSEGLSVVLYNGNGGAVYDTDALPAVTAPADAPAVAVLDYPSNGIQNGAPDAVALVQGDEVLELLSYEGTLTAAGGPAGGRTSTDIGVAETGSDPDGWSLSRAYDPARDALVWSGPAPATRGQVNPAPAGEPEPEAPRELRISAVQGSGPTSPVVGQRVVVEGVVTSLFTDDDVVSGFFLQEQDAEADADPATSEGLFAFCGSACPTGLAQGDVVRVAGAVEERFGMTQVAATAAGSTVRTGTAELPTPVEVVLPAAGSTEDPATFEHVEGMHVQIPTTLLVAESFELARYGQLVLTAETRDHTYTHVDETPTAEELAAHTARLAAKRIVLDDDNADQNDAVTGPADEPYPYLGADGGFRAGDAITGLRGVLHWSHDAWRVRPVEGADYSFASTNPRPELPDVDGRLRVASANVLNYFTTLDTTSSSRTGPCGPSGGMDCRGADSAAELERQRTKTVAALATADAHVLGLVEVQNDDDVSLVDLVAGLDGATAPGRYAYVRTGPIGTDAIKVALAYQPAVVRPVGPYAVLDSSVDPRFVDTRNRPALAQTFEEVATGSRFTVVVNHLKSKGSGCGTGDDAVDGSGNCDGTRTLAAQALVDWIATDPTGSGDPDVLVVGDLNSYRFERPIRTLQAAGYTDLVRAFGGDEAYSYLFDGQLGYLDHALANASLLPQVADAVEWHVNADEPELLDYDDAVRDAGEAAFERKSTVADLYAPDPFRSSDHDLLLVGLDLVAAPVADAGGPYVLRKDSRGPRSTVLDAGGSSDANGDALTYAWDLDGDGQFDDASGARVVVDTKGRPPGDHVVAVRVTDAGGLSDVDTAVLSVRAGRGAKG